MYLHLRSVISNPFGTRDWFHGTQFSHRWPGAVAEGTVLRTIQVHSMYLLVCLAVLGLRRGLGFSPAVVHRLLIAVASLAAEL